MNEIDKTNLTNQTNFKSNEISKTENYFNQAINQRKLCRKKISKYVAAFDYIDKILIVLSAKWGGVFIISSVSVIVVSAGVTGANLTIIFSITTGIIKKILSIKRSKTKNHNKILMLAESKPNSIETLVSQALIDMEISHQEIIAILKKKHKYEKMKENFRNANEKQENIRLSGVNLKT